MAKELQTRYPEYSRRKTVPFRLLVQQAYKTVLHSYGLDSNPSSDGDDDDDDLQEIGQGAIRQNQLGDTLNNLYAARPPRPQAPALPNNDAPIDISSDDSEDEAEGEHERRREREEEVPSISLHKINAPTENGTGTTAKPTQIAKKRRYEEYDFNRARDTVEKSQSALTLPPSSRTKKYKKQVISKKATVTFADVGGMDKTLKQLCELLLHLKHPEIYNHIGLPPPRGFLLHGPPGSGKE